MRFAALVKGAREAEAELLAALREVDEAKLYAVAGYGSLFAFCVEAHGMSEARAVKRIRAARLAGRHPRLLGMLRRGELRLGGIHVLGKLLDGSANPDRVLDRARGKTVRQLEVLAAELRPRPDVASSVRRLPAPRAAVATAVTAPTNREPRPPGDGGASGKGFAPKRDAEPAGSGALRAAGGEPPSSSDAHGLCSAPVREKRAPDPQPLRPGRYRVTVTLDEQTVAALRELQDLSAHEQPNRDPAPLIAKAIRLALAEKRRAVRKERKRTQRKKKATKGTATKGTATAETSTVPVSREADGARERDSPLRDAPPPRRTAESRRAPAAVVREVWARDEARCTYVAPDGRRCAETACLELVP